MEMVYRLLSQGPGVESCPSWEHQPTTANARADMQISTSEQYPTGRYKMAKMNSGV